MSGDDRSRNAAGACALCGGATAPYLRQDGYDYARCSGCGFVFLDPMPAAEALARVYNEEEGSISAARYPKAASRRRRALLRALSLAPMAFRRDAVDVGCGGGFMADALRRVGARATGLDISAKAIAYARRNFPKCTFFEEGFEHFAARGLAFDFLHSSEVIEHVPDARAYARFLARIARPGARLFLTTPDIAHPAVPADVTQWDMLAPPRHVHLFNETNLTALLAEARFRVVKRYAKAAPSLQILAVREG